MDVDALQTALRDLLDDPARVSVGDSDRNLHSEDMTFHPGHVQDVVVYPISTAEISRILTLADAEGVPLTPFGVGSSLEGHVIPIEGGISLDLSRMDRIVSIEPENLVATVEPGVTRAALERADSTGSGSRSTQVQTPRSAAWRRRTRPERRRCDSGRCARTCLRSRRSSPGGAWSDGLTGVQDVGRLRPHGAVRRLRGHARRDHGAHVAPLRHPGACRCGSCFVPHARGRVPDRGDLGGSGHGRAPARAPRRDQHPCDQHVRGDRLPGGAFLVRGGCRDEGSVGGDLELVLELAKEEGAIDVVHERDPDRRAKLWAARHSAAYSWTHLWPGSRHCSTDVCVPLAELPAAVTLARANADRLGLRAGILGHVGDGNFHVGVTLDPDDPAEVAGWHELSRLVVDDAIARGGTCTGEHGIGLGKVRALELEHPDLLPYYRGIKQLFDPNRIMNPGKVVPREDPLLA